MNYFLQNLIVKDFRKCVISYLIRVFLVLSLACNLASQNLDIKLLNEHKILGLLQYSLATDGESIVYLPLEDGKIKAMQISGEVVWQNELGGEIVSDLVFFSDKVLVLVIKDNEYYLIALSAKTGLIYWQSRVNASDNATIFLLNKKLILFQENKLQLFSPENGELLDNLILENNEIYVQKFGKISFPINFKIDNYIEINDGFVFTDSKGTVYCYNSLKKKVVWSKNLGGKVLSLFVKGENIYLSSIDNHLYSFRLKKGKLNWKTRFQTNLSGTPVAIDNFLFVVNQDDKSLYVLDEKNGKILKINELCSNCFVTKGLTKINDCYLVQTDNSIVFWQWKKAG